MNLRLNEAIELVSHVLQKHDAFTDKVSVLFCPSFTFLQQVKSLTGTFSDVSVSAQNCHHEKEGAFTGEVSASMIYSLGISEVIIGHSERRKYFSEDNVLLSKKINTALSEHLLPLFCCGESLEERNNNSHFEVIEKQLNESLFHLSLSDFEKVRIAYEPVWAIGTGMHATCDQAQEIHAFIRKLITGKYGALCAGQKQILYGGSCNSQNAKELFSAPDIDGGLIGGASLKADEFLKIIFAAATS